MLHNSLSSSSSKTPVRCDFFSVHDLIFLIYIIDIERKYGKRKAIAKRTPISPSGSHNNLKDVESSTSAA
jgi:hypothetical protein